MDEFTLPSVNVAKLYLAFGGEGGGQREDFGSEGGGEVVRGPDVEGYSINLCEGVTRAPRATPLEEVEFLEIGPS